MANLELNISIENEQLIQCISTTEFSEAEKMEILQTLFPQRGYVGRDRLLGVINEFIINNA